MSDISNVLRKVIELDISLGLDGTEEALAEITRLTAEVEKLRAALRECETELNAYYRMEYPSDHPYSQKKLAQAMASNPATVALGFTPLHKETSNDQG